MKIKELIQMLNAKLGGTDTTFVAVKSKGVIKIVTKVNGEITSISDIRTMLAQARSDNW